MLGRMETLQLFGDARLDVKLQLLGAGAIGLSHRAIVSVRAEMRGE